MFVDSCAFELATLALLLLQILYRSVGDRLSYRCELCLRLGLLRCLQLCFSLLHAEHVTLVHKALVSLHLLEGDLAAKHLVCEFVLGQFHELGCANIYLEARVTEHANLLATRAVRRIRKEAAPAKI